MLMKPSFERAVFGGFVGTALMTFMMYFVAPTMGPHTDNRHHAEFDAGRHSWTAGLFMHFLNASLIFPALFVYLLYGWLPGPMIVKGIAWGLTLWLIAQSVVLPKRGGGFFSGAMGGMTAVVASLIGHFLYGLALVGLCSTSVRRVAPAG
jgi:hypothetical protein